MLAIRKLNDMDCSLSVTKDLFKRSKYLNLNHLKFPFGDPRVIMEYGIPNPINQIEQPKQLLLLIVNLLTLNQNLPNKLVLNRQVLPGVIHGRTIQFYNLFQPTMNKQKQ